jgi:hypothetical protein
MEEGRSAFKMLTGKPIKKRPVGKSYFGTFLQLAAGTDLEKDD